MLKGIVAGATNSLSIQDTLNTVTLLLRLKLDKMARIAYLAVRKLREDVDTNLKAFIHHPVCFR